MLKNMAWYFISAKAVRVMDRGYYLFFKELYLSLILQENEAKDVQC